MASESVSPIQEASRDQARPPSRSPSPHSSRSPPAPSTVVTTSRDYGFWASWQKLSTCPGEPDKSQYVAAAVGFQESATDLAGNPRAIATLSLSYSSDCTGSETGIPLDAFGATDPHEYSFPVDFQQSYSIDKRIGRQGLAYATYRATIPIFPTATTATSRPPSTSAWTSVARKSQPQLQPNGRRRHASPWISSAAPSAPPSPSATSRCPPCPARPANVSGLPADLNFALYPQVFNEDGSPASSHLQGRILPAHA